MQSSGAGLNPAMRCEEVENRAPVWQALSELFLDTELDEVDLRRIANALKKSPYTTDELHAIFYDEVYPVCIYNLLGVAGEWSGFDPNWLKEEIIKRRRRKFFKVKSLCLNRWMVSEEWNRIKELLKTS